MTEKAICNKCGAEYTDKESIEQVKKWTAEGYAPCPNLSCPGQLVIRQVFSTTPITPEERELMGF